MTRVVLALALALPAAPQAPDTHSASFEVAAVRPSPRAVGPDADHQITFQPAQITARNATLRHLIAEAYRVQLNQVLGPHWLDENEYDIEAKAAGPAAREELAVMLAALLDERFHLKQHSEIREMRVYVLVADKSGPKIHPIEEAQIPEFSKGLHFHGNLLRFADLLAIQLTIPAFSDDPSRPSRAAGPPITVLDRTGLTGTYDFAAEIKPEPGADMFTLWQRFLTEKGLRLNSARHNVNVVVVDAANKLPSDN